PGRDHVQALVDLIDPRTRQRLRRIHLGPLAKGAAFGVAVPEFVAGGDVDIEQIAGRYTQDGPPSVVYHVDARTGAIVGSRTVGRHTSLAFSVTADGRRLFLSNQRDNTTWMLDATSLRVLRTYPVGADASAVRSDGRVVALGTQEGQVRLLDTRTD